MAGCRGAGQPRQPASGRQTRSRKGQKKNIRPKVTGTTLTKKSRVDVKKLNKRTSPRGGEGIKVDQSQQRSCYGGKYMRLEAVAGSAYLLARLKRDGVQGKRMTFEGISARQNAPTLLGILEHPKGL